MDDKIIKTIKYYEENVHKLYERYEKANLTKIQNYLLKYLKKEDYILEIGFGSGREINFLLNKGYKNIYGIDGCEKFVNMVRKRFKMNHFFLSILPNLNIHLNLKFDFIYSIGVFMHLPLYTYKELVKNIANRLEDNGRLFISFSLGERDDNDRYFQKVDEDLLNSFFKIYNIYKKEEFITNDSLNRNIKWKNILYKKNDEN